MSSLRRPGTSARLVLAALLVAGVLALAGSAPAAAAAAPVPPLPRPVGPDLPVSSAAGQARTASVAVQPDGGLVVVWNDWDTDQVLLGRVLPDGTVLGRWEVAPGRMPAVAVDRNGDFVVVWVGPDGGSLGGGVPALLGRRFRSDGVPRGGDFLIARGEVFFQPRIAMRPDGHFAVAWAATSAGPAAEDVHLQRFRPQAGPVGEVFVVHEERAREQFPTGLAYAPDGALWIAWESHGGETTFGDVFLRRIEPDGSFGMPPVQLNPDDDTLSTRQGDADVAVLADGRVVTVWMNRGSDPLPGTSGLQGRLVGADGTPGAVFPVNEVKRGEQALPRLVATGGRGLLVVWQDSCDLLSCPQDEVDGNDGSLHGVFGRLFAADPDRDVLAAEPVGGDFQLSRDSGGFQLEPAVAVSRGGDLAVAWSGAPGDDPSDATVYARRLAAPCSPGPSRLCLQPTAAGNELGRFRVRVSWEDFQGGTGAGTAVPRAGTGGDWGTFWFFRDSNVELAVKVLDGSRSNGYHWVFFASLSNVAFDLEVLDTATGLRRVYHNPAGTFASRGDTRALPALPLADGGAGVPAASLMAASPPPPRTAAVALPVAAGSAAALDAQPDTSPCVPAGDTACLQGGRFEVRIPGWREGGGGTSGPAGTVELTADTAYFWFFRPDNPELLVKVLDGRPVNGRFWVFFGGLTHLGFDLVVRDTESGERAVYSNPLGRFPSQGDTEAFPRGPNLADLESARRLLFVGAHPDDEVLAAPLLGELCRTGTRCTLLVATRGEGGTCRAAGGCAPNLGTVRAAEMEAAAAALGAELVQWELPDVLPATPMAVRTAWAGSAGGEAALLAGFAAVLDAVDPDAVLTFDPAHGSTGHPAHRALGALVAEVAAVGASTASLWTLQTRVELSPAGVYSLTPAVAGAQVLDATRPSTVRSGSLWDHLLAVAAVHASQFPPDRLAALAAVPPSQRRLHLARGD